VRTIGAKVFQAGVEVKPKPNRSFWYSLARGLTFKAESDCKFKRALLSLFDSDYSNVFKREFVDSVEIVDARNHREGRLLGTDQEFHLITLKFRTREDLSIVDFLKGMSDLFNTL